MIEKHILELEEIQERLQDKKLYEVANKTGVSYPTLRRLQKGEKLNYTLRVLKSISEYLQK